MSALGEMMVDVQGLSAAVVVEPMPNDDRVGQPGQKKPAYDDEKEPDHQDVDTKA